MDGPLLTKSEHDVDDEVTLIHGDSTSNEEHIANEHIVDITTNGDPSSADEQTPHEGVQWSNPFTSGCVWILVELVVTLVQIVAAIFLLNLTKDEPHSELQVLLFRWISCYTCASIASVPIVCWRLWQNASSETSTNEVMHGLEMFLEYFFVSLVLMFLLYFLTELASRDDDTTTQQFWLWLALLSFTCVRYVLPNFICALGCFLCPVYSVLKTLWEAIKSLLQAVGALCSSIFLIFLAIIGMFVSLFVEI